MRLILAVLVLGQSLDALTFALFHQVAPAEFLASPYEQNPLVVSLLAVGGVALVALVKVGLASLAYAGATGRISTPRLGSATPAPLFLAFRNVLLAGAAMSGFLGAAFNLWAVMVVLG